MIFMVERSGRLHSQLLNHTREGDDVGRDYQDMYKGKKVFLIGSFVGRFPGPAVHQETEMVLVLMLLVLPRVHGVA